MAFATYRTGIRRDWCRKEQPVFGVADELAKKWLTLKTSFSCKFVRTKWMCAVAESYLLFVSSLLEFEINWGYFNLVPNPAQCWNIKTPAFHRIRRALGRCVDSRLCDSCLIAWHLQRIQPDKQSFSCALWSVLCRGNRGHSGYQEYDTFSMDHGLVCIW